jgi:hypothetical protein
VGRQKTSGNALFSGEFQNYAFTDVQDKSANLIFFPQFYHPDNASSCNCKSHPNTCGERTGIGTISSLTASVLLFTVPGLWYGCYTIQSLFGSTFECYFNQSCLDKIYQLTSSTSNYPFMQQQ